MPLPMPMGTHRRHDLPGLAVASRFTLPFSLLIFSILYGTVGFVVLEGWPLFEGLYMTVTTLTTVGYEEIRPLDTVGRAFTLTLIGFGLVSLVATVGVLSDVLISGGLGEARRRRRMNRKLESLSNHYIICAYGRVGRTSAEEFARRRVEFVAVDSQAGLALLMQEHDIPYVIGDPAEEAVLLRAGIDRARAWYAPSIQTLLTFTSR